MANKLDDLQLQIESLQKERDALLAKEKASAIEDINSKIKSFGIRARDLDFGESFKAAPIGNKTKVAMKYRSGQHTWSGRGRKPKWVEDHLANGGELDDMLIK